MSISTRFTEKLGIEKPIMMGGMQNIAYPEFAAAVSNAGGLGTINVANWGSLEEFRQNVRKLKSLTSKPFAVNISMIPDIEIGAEVTKYIDICGEEGVKAIETAGRNPAELVEQIHSYDMVHIHKVPSVRHAVKAESLGVDIVSIIGSEAAGHPSPDLVGTLVLINRATSVLTIPVLCGGGIVDGRGLLAALALGAEGVIMGTRFMATTECPISDEHKQWILDHDERATVLCQQSIRNTMRAADTEAARRCLEMEQEKACTVDDLMPIISGAISKEAYRIGDLTKGIFPVGQNIGSINEVMSVDDLMTGIIEEAQETMERLNCLRA